MGNRRYKVVSHKQVLLVSSSKYPERWIVPGGGVEQDETNAETAVREIKEEAGVVGRLSRCLGVFEVNTTAFHYAGDTV